jgi:hypothetical protein
LKKSINAEDVIIQKSSKGNKQQNGDESSWMNVEDQDSNAIMVNLDENTESYTGFNGKSNKLIVSIR